MVTVNVKLVSAKLDYDFTQSSGEVVASLFGVHNGTSDMKSELTVSLSGTGAVNFPERTFVVTSTSKKSSAALVTEVVDAYSSSTNDTLDKAIVMLDKNLNEAMTSTPALAE